MFIIYGQNVFIPVTPEGRNILSSMAQQNGSLYDVEPEPNTRTGRFIPIANPDQLRMNMGLYYEIFLKRDVQPQPVITIPYIDAFGLGNNSLCLL